MLNNFLQRIRYYFKNAFDRLNNQGYKNSILQAIPFWGASIITGLIAVIYTKLFLLAESVTRYVYHEHAWGLFILTPMFFLLAWWTVVRYAPYARGSGIPQVVAAIQITGPNKDSQVSRLLSIRVMLVKISSSLIMAAGGAAIGREGPTIQIAASVFKKVNDLLPVWWPKVAKKNMIITGAAAGLAAAFNTPLGGIVFAIEELTKTHFSYFKTAIFSSVIIAGLAAQGILGPYLYLGYPKIFNLSGYIFFGVILVAVISGLLGSAMSKIILVILKWKSSFKFTRHHILYIGGCALILSAIAIFISSDVLGSGKEIMQTTLFSENRYVNWYTPILRIVGPILSFTTGASGGIFAPALASGASIGSMVSGWFQLSEANTNLLILSGMVGFLTGVTRSPFTSAILVLEMTNRHSVIFHLILAGMISSVVSLLIDKHSLYDHLKVQYIKDLEAEESRENEGRSSDEKHKSSNLYGKD
ncbi:chloride channel protein [Pedobacter ginsengisoli]|uniref:chloride channel protein n=1 Tax=Pedobacter ginsengisoli TaxID=363852 RepID=UPI0025513571|nr:chloride channel protein [Pedobacter ginsengisoli]